MEKVAGNAKVTQRDDVQSRTWERIKIFKTFMLVFPFAAMVSKINQYAHNQDIRYVRIRWIIILNEKETDSSLQLEMYGRLNTGYDACDPVHDDTGHAQSSRCQRTGAIACNVARHCRWAVWRTNGRRR